MDTLHKCLYPRDPSQFRQNIYRTSTFPHAHCLTAIPCLSTPLYFPLLYLYHRSQNSTLSRCIHHMLTLDFWVEGHVEQSPAQCGGCCLCSSKEEVQSAADEVFFIETCSSLIWVLQKRVCTCLGRRFVIISIQSQYTGSGAGEPMQKQSFKVIFLSTFSACRYIMSHIMSPVQGDRHSRSSFTLGNEFRRTHLK